MQVETVDGHPVLLFSCLARHATPARRTTKGGVWAVNAESVTGPFDIDTAYPLTDESLYVGRLLRRRDGQWLLFAFHNKDRNGDFTGGIADPMEVHWRDGRLVAGHGHTAPG